MKNMFYKNIFILFLIALPQSSYCLFPKNLEKKVNRKVVLGTIATFACVLIAFFAYKNYKNSQQKKKKNNMSEKGEEDVIIKENDNSENKNKSATDNKESLESEAKNQENLNLEIGYTNKDTASKSAIKNVILCDDQSKTTKETAVKKIQTQQDKIPAQDILVMLNSSVQILIDDFLITYQNSLLSASKIIEKLKPAFFFLESIKESTLEENFKLFLDRIFMAGIRMDPDTAETCPVVNLVGTILQNTLSDDEYMKLLLYTIRYDAWSFSSILKWTIKTNLHLFFKTIDEEKNTLLHKILSSEYLSHDFAFIFKYLVKAVEETDRSLINTKNNNGENFLFSLLQNTRFKNMYGYEWQYINALIASGVDVNVQNNKKEYIFDLVLKLTEFDQIEIFWNLFNMPHYHDIPKYSPQDIEVKQYFKNVEKNILIKPAILTTFLSHFNKLHEYAKNLIKKDNQWTLNNSREPYIKSFWLLEKTCDILKSDFSFKYMDYVFFESKERWLRTKEKIRKNLAPAEKIVDCDPEGLDYDVYEMIYMYENEGGGDCCTNQKLFEEKLLPNGSTEIIGKIPVKSKVKNVMGYRWTQG